jgi:hypothetical protein
MALEEGELMASLRDTMPVRELFDVDMRLRGAVAPDLMCRFITVMVPAMNPDERFSMLAGMQGGAPAEIFERSRSPMTPILPLSRTGACEEVVEADRSTWPISRRCSRPPNARRMLQVNAKTMLLGGDDRCGVHPLDEDRPRCRETRLHRMQSWSTRRAAVGRNLVPTSRRGSFFG